MKKVKWLALFLVVIISITGCAMGSSTGQTSTQTAQTPAAPAASAATPAPPASSGGEN